MRPLRNEEDERDDAQRREDAEAAKPQPVARVEGQRRRERVGLRFFTNQPPVPHLELPGTLPGAESRPGSI